MKYTRFLLTMFFVAGFIGVKAGNAVIIDARQFLTPIISASKDIPVNSLSFENSFMLQWDAANSIFHSSPQELTITNFDIPLHGESTLILRKTRDVFDANSQFFVNTPGGKRRIRVRPIDSYLGVVKDDAGSRVTLHYSDGDLTGFIQHSDGTRTNIGRDFEKRDIQGASPHFVSNENAISVNNTFSNFVCGSQDFAVDNDDLLRSMLMPSALKSKGETIQQLPLLELKLAIVAREEIDSVLKRRGYDDEMVVQHFAKIISAMSQAFEEDLRTHLYISYFLAHTVDAPSGYLSDGRDPDGLLDEFSLDWSSGYSFVDRTIAHIYTLSRPSGGYYIGGVAYGGGGGLGSRLCIKQNKGGYGVSTLNLTAPSQMPGPPTVKNAFVWDVYVGSHEMGHNVGAPHTHNCFWSPPVDTCLLVSDNTDACYDKPSLRRAVPGTIMSYCHLVNGSSTPLTFGSRVSERMRTWIESAACVNPPPAPLVRITSPRGPETWKGDQTVVIKWVSTNVSYINLEYKIGDGDVWVPIVGNVPAADSQYVWKVPRVAASQLWIRISDASDISIFNISISSYSVSVPITLTAPVGGERIGKNTVKSIRWTKTINDNINISFAPDGVTFENVASNVSENSYDWTTPDIVTESAVIRLTSVANSGVFAQSNSFALGAPWLNLLIPAEGAIICSDVFTQYKWEGDFIERIKIQYSTDDGASWKNALTQANVEMQQLQIFSRGASLNNIPNGTSAILRVTEIGPDTVLDTHSNMKIDSCGIVTSVEGSSDITGLRILNIAPNPASTYVDISVFSSNPGNADLVLIDATGRELYLSNISLPGSREAIINVPLNNTTPGIYRLVMKSGSTTHDAPLNIVR